ncbi:MAG: hypothetical protein J2O49_02165 [Sciscionella sp.]|nr:hypothetical protein [Sciscionella sp.]
MSWFKRHRDDAPVDAKPVAAQQKGAPDPEQAAHAFWRRWVELLPEISAALGDREPQRFEDALCAAVSAMHPDLHFAVERGQRAIYALVVTGQEDPALRRYTDAWKAAAPEESPFWEYHDSVPPVPDPNEVTVNIGEHRIPLADVRVVALVDEADGVVDVAVYHPKMAELTDPMRQAMTFLPLDATLGERLAGSRLRRVETALVEPANAITLTEFRDLVSQLDTPAD